MNGSNLTNLINNYDVLLNERSVDTNRIRRREIFRRGSGTAWTYYYVFDFANGSAAVSFRYRNPGRMEAVFTPERVRIQIGAMIFTPDFATVDKEYIGPGQSAIGYVFFKKPEFRPGLEPPINGGANDFTKTKSLALGLNRSGARALGGCVAGPSGRVVGIIFQRGRC